MANGHGGYREPKHPAPVSGPGKYSRRTDGGPGDGKQPARYVSGMPYGEGQQLMDLQGQAPMSAEAGPPALPSITPLHAPTERPGEPITHGAPFGPGGGPEVNPLGAQPDLAAASIRAAYAQNPSPQLGALVAQLDAEGR